MTNVRAYLRITGLGAEKQLTHLQKNNFVLYDIRRIDLRTMEFACRRRDSASILELLSDRGFSCTVLSPRGTAKALHQLKDRTPLIIFLFSALLALSCAMRCIWRIEIVGAGPYIGEVRTFLQEEFISPGTVSDRISLKDLSARLTQRLPRIAWVHASFEGLTLRIAVTQGVPMPEIETQGANGSVIAARDGVIESIAVYAGTAAIKAGDTVKAGDILIHGYERTSNEALIPVRARGKITALTYLTESASVSAKAYETLRTGNHQTITLLHFPFFSYAVSDTPDYLTGEYESQFLPLGGAWLPVKIERRTVHEVYYSQQSPDENDLRAQAARLSMQKLLHQCAENDEIIDKWLYYSMIEGDFLSATVTAQIRTEIGIFSPETPE